LVTMRVSPRVECCSLWERMRASGGCGLSPDEHAVITFLLDHANGTCGVVTDFPEVGSVVRVIGRRRYYESKVGTETVAATLRVAGSWSSRNSYLRRDGVVEFDSFESPSASEWFGLFEELGEWCHFTPE
jgi:hypothetical protein